MSKTPMRPTRQTAKMPTKPHGPFGLLKTGDYTLLLALTLTLMVVALAAFVCIVVCRNKRQKLAFADNSANTETTASNDATASADNNKD